MQFRALTGEIHKQFFALALAISWAAAPLFSSSLALADDSGIIKVSGLSFRCPNCQVLADGLCQITAEGEPLLLKCEVVPEKLLAELSRLKIPPELPTANELWEFISDSNGSDASSIKAAILLLLATPEGRSRFLKEDYSIPGVVSEALYQLIVSGEVDRDFLREVLTQSLPRINDTKLKSAIFLYAPNVSASDIIGALTAVDISKDRELLLEVVELADAQVASSTPASHSWLEPIRALSSVFESCLLDSPGPCDQSALDALAEEERRAFQREMITSVIKRDKASPIAGIELLSIISQHRLQEARTPDLHGLVARALAEELPRLDLALQAKALGENDEALRVFAKNDSRIAKALESLNDTDLNHGYHITPRTYLGFGLVLVALVFGLRRLIGRNSPALSGVSPSERSELRELLQYFGLAATSEETDLSREYRLRAKELHPDMGVVDSVIGEGFTELAEKYRRARELIARR